MPANVVKPGQEKDWEKAKEQAEKQGQKENWAYVMSIFKKMVGKEAAASRVASRYLKKASGFSLMDSVIPEEGFSDLYWKLEKEDKMSADLLRAVYDKLADRFKMSSSEEDAMSKIIWCIRNKNAFRVDALRNYIFKAAHSLGMKLPSSFF